MNGIETFRSKRPRAALSLAPSRSSEPGKATSITLQAIPRKEICLER